MNLKINQAPEAEKNCSVNLEKNIRGTVHKIIAADDTVILDV